MTELTKIEVGKKYRTRDGRVALAMKLEASTFWKADKCTGTMWIKLSDEHGNEKNDCVWADGASIGRSNKYRDSPSDIVSHAEPVYEQEQLDLFQS